MRGPVSNSADEAAGRHQASAKSTVQSCRRHQVSDPAPSNHNDHNTLNSVRKD